MQLSAVADPDLTVSGRNYLALSLEGTNPGPYLCLFGTLICDQHAELSIGTASALPGEAVEVALTGSSECGVLAYSAAIGHDAARVELLSTVTGPLIDDLEPELYLSTALEGWTLAAALWPASPAVSLPADTLLLTMTYRVSPDAAPGTMVLRNAREVEGSVGSFGLYSSADGFSIFADLSDGSIIIGSAGAIAPPPAGGQPRPASVEPPRFFMFPASGFGAGTTVELEGSSWTTAMNSPLPFAGATSWRLTPAGGPTRRLRFDLMCAFLCTLIEDVPPELETAVVGLVTITVDDSPVVVNDVLLLLELPR